MEKKTCSRCLVEKSTVEFNRDKASKDGFSSMCKSCNRDNCRVHYGKNIKKHRLLGRLYYLKHKEERRHYRCMNREKNKKYQASYRKRRKHFLSLLQRQRQERLQAKQDLRKKEADRDDNLQISLLACE